MRAGGGSSVEGIRCRCLRKAVPKHTGKLSQRGRYDGLRRNITFAKRQILLIKGS